MKLARNATVAVLWWLGFTLANRAMAQYWPEAAQSLEHCHLDAKNYWPLTSPLGVARTVQCLLFETPLGNQLRFFASNLISLAAGVLSACLPYATILLRKLQAAANNHLHATSPRKAPSAPVAQ